MTTKNSTTSNGLSPITAARFSKSKNTSKQKALMSKGISAALCVSVFGFSALGPAQANAAEETFDVVFNYTQSANPEKTYRSFQATARRACRSDYSSRIGLHLRYEAERECEADLINQAVRKTGHPALLAIHTEHVAN